MGVATGTGGAIFDNMGIPIPLEEMPDWAGLKDFEAVTKYPWFVHIRTPKLNTVGPGSPLGVSVLAASADSSKSRGVTATQIISGKSET